MVLLSADIKRNNLKNITYANFESIVNYRLNILKKEDIKSFRLLVAMSVLGTKFYPAMLENFDNNSPQDFEKIIEKLVNMGYITQLNSLSFEFKNNDFWKIIVSVVKNDECFEEILNIFVIIKGYFFADFYFPCKLKALQNSLGHLIEIRFIVYFFF